MNGNLRRFLVALAAWPLGIVAALAFLFLRGESTCPPGQACALSPVAWWRVVLWLLCALGPGVLATRAWWRGWRRAA